MARTRILVSILAASTALSAPALAQDAPTQAAAQAQLDGGKLGEIVVTARRRSENLQDTPVSVTALNENLLRQRQIERTIDIAQSVPGLYINNISASPSSLVVFLRGAGEQTGGLATAESPVGIYLDDVYLARLANGNLDLADVERIEVLRGPQGTLYGRNTMTGALKIVTRRPGDTLWVRAEAGYGRFDQTRFKAAVSGPVGNGVGGLVSGYYSDRDGWFDNLGVDPKRGDRRTYGGRVSFATTNSGPVQAQVAAFYSKDRNDGVTPVPTNPFPPYQSLTGEFSTTRSPVEAYGRNRQWGVTGNVSIELAEKTSLKAITGYIDSRDAWGLDFSGGFNNGANIVAGFFRQSATKQHQFSQELQLQGKAMGNRLDYIVGAYFFTESADQLLNDSFGTGVFGPFPVALLPTSFRVKTKSYAGFGQLDYKLTEQLSVTGGIRYTFENKDFQGTIQNGFGFPPVLSSLIRTSLDEKKWTPKVGVNFKLDREVLLYASITNGFKAGGFNGLAVANPAILGAPYGAESVWAYEAGLKSELLDRRLRLNVAYFYNDLKDIQQNVVVGGGSTRTENAARATLQGVEAEVSAVPLEGLTLFGSISLNWDKYKSLSANSTVLAAGATRLPLVSKLQSQLGASYRVPLAAIGGAILLNADWSHRSSRFADALNSGISFIGPVDRVNASIGYETEGGRWSASLSARNLLNDKDYYSGLALIPGLIAGRFAEEPLTWMATIRFRLGR